jgi:hypothetical protein
MKVHGASRVALGLAAGLAIGLAVAPSSSSAAVYGGRAATEAGDVILKAQHWGGGWGWRGPGWGWRGRPYWYARPWARRPYYGTIIAGVALGTLITVAAVGAVPPRPAPYLCWYWADPYHYRGYWDYCY